MIELDGRYHENEKNYTKDLLRDADLKTYNLIILRFSEAEVKNDIENVIRTIESYILKHQLNISK